MISESPTVPLGTQPIERWLAGCSRNFFLCSFYAMTPFGRRQLTVMRRGQGNALDRAKDKN